MEAPAKPERPDSGSLVPILDEVQKEIRRGIWNPHPPYPFAIGVEITNRCNIDCVMCSRLISRRPIQDMELDVFKKIVDETAGYPLTLFEPQGLGESMMHRDWKEMIRYTAEKKLQHVLLITNGTLLSEDKADLLLDVGVETIIFSIDGATRKTYERVRRGADFETMEKNVRYFLRRKQELGLERPRVMLRIIKMKETETELEAFKDRWRPLLSPNDELAENEYNTWAGTVDYVGPGTAMGLQKFSPCQMVWKNASIFSNGDVACCCYDVHGELIVGNIKDQTLHEIWTGPRIERLRDIHRKLEFKKLPICERCESSVAG